MSDKTDILAKHAERRRAFLVKTAVTSPAVGLLLAQAARPARAATYAGGPPTTPLETTVGTIPPTTTGTTTTAGTTTITTTPGVSVTTFIFMTTTSFASTAPVSTTV